MANYRLREALTAAGLSPATVACDLDVDPKTVERWVTQNRVPYPRHRQRLAATLGSTEEHLWPDIPLDLEQEEDDEAEEAAHAEVTHIYPHRAAVPAELWRRLLGRATGRIDILAYTGLFLVEQHPQIVRTLRDKATAGVSVRLLFGDPASATITARGEDDGSASDVAARFARAQSHYRSLAGQRGVAVRLHRTTPYTSIYQFDDEMLVNPHMYGLPASHTPVMHLRRVPVGELLEMYFRSFEAVWQNADPAWDVI